MYSIIKVPKGKKEIIESIVEKETGEVISPKYTNLTKEDYESKGVYFIEPMTAKEYLNDKELEEMLTSTEYIAEEKLDGTRCTFHIYSYNNRLFSRRISVKTNWYTENSDSVPHLRDLEVPKEFHNTVLDGEMRIDGLEFKDVSSTLNCTWDEAIARQQEIGFITYHAFDIIYYKGVYVAKMPLIKRKELLKKVVTAIDNQYVMEEKYTDDLMFVRITNELKDQLKENEEAFKNRYPDLYGCLVFSFRPEEIWKGLLKEIALPKKAWYEYILLHGGEGIMLKPKNGKYRHKRGREYTKLKKFSTWDVVILDFIEPTKEYTGKELDNPHACWNYWLNKDTDEILIKTLSMKKAKTRNLIPVTKHYAKEWVGTLKYGVVITEQELEKWKKTNPKDKPEVIETKTINNTMTMFLVVGECSGFDEETREYITNNKDKLYGTVIEVGANEIMKTGKLRHPRFIRFRNDKSVEQCIWKDHVRK